MALEGTFHDMSLSDLFQIFHLSTKSGILRMFNGSKRGIIYVYEGRLVDAFVVCRFSLKVLNAHDEAVLALMNWDDTTVFLFQHNPATYRIARHITRTSAWLIREGLRQRSEMATRTHYQAITLDTPLQLAQMPMSTEDGITLEAEDWRIMTHLAHQKTLRRVCMLTETDPAEAIRIATELLSIGLIEIIPVSVVVAEYAVKEQANIARTSSQLPTCQTDGFEETASSQLIPQQSGNGLNGKVLLR